MKTGKILLFTLTAVLAFASISGCKAAIDKNITISAEELDSEVQKTKTGLERQGYEITDTIMEEFEKDVLKQMIENQIFLRLIKSEKFELEEGLLDEEIETIIAGFPSEEEFYSTIANDGFTKDSFREEFGNSLLQQKYKDEVVGVDVEAKEEEIQAFYDDNPEYFKTEESATASHILIEIGADFTESQKNDAKKQIESILKKAKSGDDFAELAKEYSEGPSSVNGGSLGEFSRGQMVAPFEEAAFALNPGEISEVVETQFGFHIIKLFEKSTSSWVPFEQVSMQISDHLVSLKTEEEIRKKIDKARDRFELDIPFELTWE